MLAPKALFDFLKLKVGHVIVSALQDGSLSLGWQCPRRFIVNERQPTSNEMASLGGYLLCPPQRSEFRD